MLPFLYTFFGGSKYYSGRQFLKFLKNILLLFQIFFKFFKKYFSIIILFINFASFRRGYRENIFF